MHWIDWTLVVLPVLGVLVFALYTRRYVKSVADFLAGGRCAGRYLLANARGESDSGLTNTMSKFEIILVSGFVLNFWEKVSVPVLLLVGISGFVVYRFRETRALTLAQFLEMRYSRGFRLYMGGLAFLSGILNYGIFPAVSSKFFIYFLDLPETVEVMGWGVPTFALIMGGYLAFTVLNVLLGGQVTMMVTDCIEGIFSHAAYIVIVIAVFMAVGWKDIVETMSAAPAEYSLINPFDAGKVEDFNIWYVVMALLLSVYGTMALQNRQGFNAAAKSPHESRMAGILGQWRGYARILMLLALGICTATFIRHPDFQEKSEPARAQIAAIGGAASAESSPAHPVGSQEWFHDPATPQIQRQMTAPVALSHLLPVGVKGLFVAIMIMGLLAGDAGHLHSWGSIFVQDVIMPLRKRELSPGSHIWALRLSVTGVALFAFTFSLMMPQTQYIVLWMAVTGAVFVGGAGAAIIGGLYWSRGTVEAAWAAALTGSGLSLGGILVNSFWKQITPWARDTVGLDLPAKFYFNGQQCAFIAALAAVGVYVVVSLLTCKKPYDLDAMLHRSSNGEARKPAAVLALVERFRLKNILKFDQNFTVTDKLVAGGIFWWAMLLLGVNLVVSVWNLYGGHWPVSWWSTYWLVTAIILPFVIALVTLVWFGVGGIRDTRDFFHALRTMKRDVTDDGRVVHPPTASTPLSATPAIPAPPAEAVPAKALTVTTPTLSPPSAVPEPGHGVRRVLGEK